MRPVIAVELDASDICRAVTLPLITASLVCMTEIAAAFADTPVVLFEIETDCRPSTTCVAQMAASSTERETLRPEISDAVAADAVTRLRIFEAISPLVVVVGMKKIDII